MFKNIAISVGLVVSLITALGGTAAAEYHPEPPCVVICNPVCSVSGSELICITVCTCHY